MAKLTEAQQGALVALRYNLNGLREPVFYETATLADTIALESYGVIDLGRPANDGWRTIRITEAGRRLLAKEDSDVKGE